MMKFENSLIFRIASMSDHDIIFDPFIIYGVKMRSWSQPANDLSDLLHPRRLPRDMTKTFLFNPCMFLKKIS